jgi:uncharacterized protein YjbI with pentapeptide repeats
MANEDDLARLLSGERDLSGSDLTNADIAYQDLSGRDFSFAKLHQVKALGTNFSRCTFEGTSVLELAADGANFSGVTISGIILQRCSFVGANFSDSVLSSSVFQDVDFSRADLTGSNFRSAQLIGSTSFDGAITNDSTDFDGAAGSRSLSRSRLFKDYSYVGGRFRQKAGAPNATAFEPAAAETVSLSGQSRIDLSRAGVTAQSGDLSGEAKAGIFGAEATAACRIGRENAHRGIAGGRCVRRIAAAIGRAIRRRLDRRQRPRNCGANGSGPRPVRAFGNGRGAINRAAAGEVRRENTE